MKKWGNTICLNPTQILTFTSILYLIFPIILFCFGWLKPVISILFLIILIYSVLKVFQTEEKYQFKFTSRKRYLIIAILIIAFMWVLLSGIGGIGLQNWDFHGRNALLRDLITHSWPVKYDYANQPEMAAIFGPSAYLSYYFSFFLPAAVVGKVLGWNAANIFLFLWSWIGVVLTIFLINRHIKKTSIFVFVAFIFFSGMDFLGIISLGEKQIFDIFATGAHIEWWAKIFQYSSMTTQLFNVFNQSIPAWIITVLTISQKNNRNLFFYNSLMVFYGPFPFIGLFPIVLYKFLEGCKDNKNSWNKWLTFQNIVGGGFILFIGIIFMTSNVGEHDFGFIWNIQSDIASSMIIYLFFCLIEFLILGLIIYPLQQNRNRLLFILGLLALFPLYRYGHNYDFTMRASIPALLLLFLFTFKAFSNLNHINKKVNVLRIMIVIILIIGSITPLIEIGRSINSLFVYGARTKQSDEWISFDFGGSEDKIETVPNFVVSASDDPLFFQFLGK